jgi:hypothetical protein
MHQIPIAVFVTALLCSGAAQAAEWQPLERQCAEEVERSAGCTTACVNRLFPEIARCVNARLRHPVPPAALERCIPEVSRARTAARACELCGDPVDSTFQCAAQ